jgi:hypothetical protein
MKRTRSRLSPLLWIWFERPDGSARKRIQAARRLFREELASYEAEGWDFVRAGERR